MLDFLSHDLSHKSANFVFQRRMSGELSRATVGESKCARHSRQNCNCDRIIDSFPFCFGFQMDPSILNSSTALDVVMKQAHEQYDDFVDIHGPILTLPEFIMRQSLPLNEQYASVLYDKTAHLSDIDFVEIDRTMLNLIGFNDFRSAIRCLRKTVGFVEGNSFDNTDAHFVVGKNGALSSSGLWVRMRALDHFIMMANTPNSYNMREFFLDMKRIHTEYNKYQMVYNIQHDVYEQGIMIDTQIQELHNDIHSLMEKSDLKTSLIEKQTRLIEKQSEKLNVMSQLLSKK